MINSPYWLDGSITLIQSSGTAPVVRWADGSFLVIHETLTNEVEVINEGITAGHTDTITITYNVVITENSTIDNSDNSINNAVSSITENSTTGESSIATNSGTNYNVEITEIITIGNSDNSINNAVSSITENSTVYEESIGTSNQHLLLDIIENVSVSNTETTNTEARITEALIVIEYNGNGESNVIINELLATNEITTIRIITNIVFNGKNEDSPFTTTISTNNYVCLINNIEEL